jgi:hypothetical protein
MAAACSFPPLYMCVSFSPDKVITIGKTAVTMYTLRWQENYPQRFLLSISNALTVRSSSVGATDEYFLMQVVGSRVDTLHYDIL